MHQGQGGEYGCPKFKEFYTAYPDQPVPPYSITKELHDAIVNNTRQLGEKFEQDKKTRLDELKQLYAGDDSDTGAVYFKLLSSPSTTTMAEMVRKCVYIGSAIDINTRQRQHKLAYKHNSKLMPRAYVDVQQQHTTSILIRGHEEMVRSVEYLALSLKNIHRESSGADETGQWHSINCRMPYPQLPPGKTSGVEDERKMRRLVAEVLLDALFSPEQLDLEPFNEDLAADIQQEDDSSQQSSSASILEANITATPKSTRQHVRGKRPSATTGASSSSEFDVNNEKWTSRIERGKKIFKRNKELKSEVKELRKKNRQRQRNEHALKRQFGIAVESETEQSSADEELNDSVFANETFFNDDDDDFSH